MSHLQITALYGVCALAAYWSYSCFVLLRAIERQNAAILAALKRVEYEVQDHSMPELK